MWPADENSCPSLLLSKVRSLSAIGTDLLLLLYYYIGRVDMFFLAKIELYTLIDGADLYNQDQGYLTN